MIVKTFQDINLVLTPPPPSGGGGGGGKPEQGDGEAMDHAQQAMKRLAENGNKERDGVPANGRDQNQDPSFKETKEKLDREMIRQMIEKLVCGRGNRKVYGTDYLHKRKIARDLSAGAEIRIPRDTYNFNKEPVAFYFDFSGSCEAYSMMFAQMTAGLIAKGATTYIGLNGGVNIRIDRAPTNATANDIKRILYGHNDQRFSIKRYNRENIVNLIKKEQIKKIVFYTDYDAALECVQVSEMVPTIWFCAQEGTGNFRRRGKTLHDFKGQFFRATTMEQVKNVLTRLNDASFEQKDRKIQIGQ
jgi:hypothetical protein